MSETKLVLLPQFQELLLLHKLLRCLQLQQYLLGLRCCSRSGRKRGVEEWEVDRKRKNGWLKEERDKKRCRPQIEKGGGERARNNREIVIIWLHILV